MDLFLCLQFPRSAATSHSQTQIESHLKLALRGLEATRHQVHELVTIVKDQSQQIERQSQHIERQSQQIERQSQQMERQSQQIKRQSGQIKRVMSTAKERSEKMERLMSTVHDQPPAQREQPGPINQTFSTPFEWKIPNIEYAFHFAQCAGSQSLVSEPFYLFRCGYRYLLQIELTTSMYHRSRLLSVFIKVVPGEFDESLSWPCKEKVRVTLVDHSPLHRGKTKNKSGVIDFEKGEEPFSRPLRDDHHEYRPIPTLRNTALQYELYSWDDTMLIIVNRE